MVGKSRALEILKYNLKINIGWNYLLTFLMCTLFVLIFNLKFITYNNLVQISELYFGLIGVILFTAIGNTERSEKMEQFIITRIPYIYLVILRIVMAICFTFLCVYLVLTYAKVNSGDFNLWKCTFGIAISIILVGFFGMAVTNSCNDSRAGYIAAMSYYLIEYRTKGDYTGIFFIYGILENRERAVIGSAALLLILLIYNLLIIERKVV